VNERTVFISYAHGSDDDANVLALANRFRWNRCCSGSVCEWFAAAGMAEMATEALPPHCAPYSIEPLRHFFDVCEFSKHAHLWRTTSACLARFLAEPS
jgi:hypothetical protein